MCVGHTGIVARDIRNADPDREARDPSADAERARFERMLAAVSDFRAGLNPDRVAPATDLYDEDGLPD